MGAAHRAFLHEIGAPFEAVPGLVFTATRRAAADFLAVNPEGKVPTLLVNGRPLTEVAGILYYLARAYPEAKLMPRDDPEAEAHVVSWMSFVASSIHPARRQGLEHAMSVYRDGQDRAAGRSRLGL